MNYIDEDTGFERWCENNYLPIQSQAIWKKLFKRFNRSGWSEWVTVGNLTLMSDVQISNEKTFINYRDKLIDAGLIEYIKGKKGQPNKYRLISFEKYTGNIAVHSTVETTVKATVYPTVETTVYPTDITKLNETKPNQTIERDARAKDARSPAHKHGSYNNVLFTDEELEKLKTEFPDDWSERIERLSEYIASTGKKYKDYLATIRSWAKKDKTFVSKKAAEQPDFSDTSRYTNLEME